MTTPIIRFQATKEGNYSVGACYLAINNLPRHMRFLRENISLCLIMPGPNEPDSYALDQMLGPLVDELLQLKQGASSSKPHSHNVADYTRSTYDHTTR